MDSTLANRLRKNLARLRPWARREGLEAWRLYDCDIPEWPWTIDLYGEHALVTEYRTAVGRRQDEAGRAAERSTVVAATAEVLAIPVERVACRIRERHRSIERQSEGDASHEFAVKERGIQFLVNLDDYLDTGLFLDHREARRRVGAQSSGKRVLNLFCYTGAFTAYAIRGGATRAVSVDLSPTYLAWAERNLRLNGLLSAKPELVRADVFAYLDSCTEQFDVIVVDPPTVSRSAKGRSFDLQSAHVELIQRAAARLAGGGSILFSTNDRTFQLKSSAIGGLGVAEISAETQSRDFREAVHRSWELRKN